MPCLCFAKHYNDVIMSAMVSQITSLTIFTQRLFRHRWKKTSKLRVTGLCEGNSPVTDEFPAQRASNEENATVWWRHHDERRSKYIFMFRFVKLNSTSKGWGIAWHNNVMIYGGKLFLGCFMTWIYRIVGKSAIHLLFNLLLWFYFYSPAGLLTLW